MSRARSALSAAALLLSCVAMLLLSARPAAALGGTDQLGSPAPSAQTTPTPATQATPTAQPSPQATPTPAPVDSAGSSSPCPNPLAMPLCAAGSAIQGIGGGIVGGAVQAVTQWVADGAVGLLGQISTTMGDTTTPLLGSTWFEQHYATMASIAALLMLPVLLLAIFQGMLRGDPIAMLKAALWRVPIAIFFTVIAGAVVGAALSVTDGMSTAVAAGMGQDLQTFLHAVSQSVATVLGASQPIAPLFVVFLCALVLALGALFIFVELVVREAAVYICVLFLPLVLATTVWEPARVWTKRLIELLAAVVLSKFVIIAILSLGAGALASLVGSGGPSLAALLMGVGILVFAAWSPLKLLRLIPMIESSVAAGVHGTGATAARGVVGEAGSAARTVALAGAGGGGGGATAGTLKFAGAEASPSLASLGGGTAARFAADQGGRPPAPSRGGSAEPPPAPSSPGPPPTPHAAPPGGGGGMNRG